mgnify:FL=1
MKKLFVSAGIVSAMFLASCGEGSSEICDCADMSVAMMNEMKGMEDMAKMTEITEKYAAQAEKCEKMGEGKSDEELKAMEEEMKGCASFKEMEKMMSGGH